MSDLFTAADNAKPDSRPDNRPDNRMGQNLPEFTVSELAGGIKRTLEETYGRVRVRGEVSQPKLHTSGHMYLSLKDENSVISAVCWKGQLGKLAIRPEEGMDVVATGRITTYPARSNYQLVIEELTLAGQGALLKLLQERKEKLQKEGLFDPARKKALPRFPQTIGVITSPTGAVIRDILHRLSDRYPVHVLLWPVAVQGEAAATQVASAIAGMNALPQKPDVIIVARGGGSLEDLMAFNEEVVVRAAAASRIPLISAVGHETDTTLIDFAADVRAPTPTAAAELATPVRRELADQLQQLQARASRVFAARLQHAGAVLDKYAAGIAQPQRYLETKAQRLDDAVDKHRRAGGQLTGLRAQKLAALHLLHPRQMLQQAALRVTHSAQRLAIVRTVFERAATRLETTGKLLNSYSYEGILGKGFALVRGADGTVVTSAAQLKKADSVSLTFRDGSKDAVVN